MLLYVTYQIILQMICGTMMHRESRFHKTSHVDFVENLTNIFYLWFQPQKLGWTSESLGLRVKPPGKMLQNTPFPPYGNVHFVMKKHIIICPKNFIYYVKACNLYT